MPLGVKGLGPISAFWPITSEDFKPLTQRIGPATRCKATLRGRNEDSHVLYMITLVLLVVSIVELRVAFMFQTNSPTSL
jgi:hypothetical protein